MCPATPEILLTAKHTKQGGQTHLNFTGSLLHLASETAQTPGSNDAQPCPQRAKPWEPPENQTRPEVLEGRSGRRCEFLHSSSPLHTTYTNSVLKPAHTSLRYAPCSSPWFFFSPISVFCFWWGLAVEVLNNRNGSRPVADSDMRARAHQILLLHSRFRYPKKFRRLTKLNFLRVNYP